MIYGSVARGTMRFDSDIDVPIVAEVELALKGMLRYVCVDPPKWHDVGGIPLVHAALLPADLQRRLPEPALRAQ